MTPARVLGNFKLIKKMSVSEANNNYCRLIFRGSTKRQGICSECTYVYMHVYMTPPETYLRTIPVFLGVPPPA